MKHSRLNPDQLLANRMAPIQPFHVMALLEQAKQLEAGGADVIHLEVGEPDFATPEPILQAGIAALKAGETKYTAACGIPPLREAIANYYQSRYHTSVSSDQIIVTPGASGGLFAALTCLVNPKEQVMLSDPGYPCNRNFVEALGATPLMVPVTKSSNYQLSQALVSSHWNDSIKTVLLANPSNPTGTMIPKESMQQIVELCHSRRSLCIIDEIYQGLTYNHDLKSTPSDNDNRAVDYTSAGISPDIFVLNSFSKFFGMTGWRIGWMVVPKWATESINKIMQNFFIAAPTQSQHAALAAFSEETQAILEERRQEMANRRNYLSPALAELGFEIACQPEGAFYIYADISNILANREINSFDFCQTLLTSSGVAITPGRDFGHHKAEQMVRIAYTTDIDRLKEAVARLKLFLNTWRK